VSIKIEDLRVNLETTCGRKVTAVGKVYVLYTITGDNDEYRREIIFFCDDYTEKKKVAKLFAYRYEGGEMAFYDNESFEIHSTSSLKRCEQFDITFNQPEEIILPTCREDICGD